MKTGKSTSVERGDRSGSTVASCSALDFVPADIADSVASDVRGWYERHRESWWDRYAPFRVWRSWIPGCEDTFMLDLVQTALDAIKQNSFQKTIGPARRWHKLTSISRGAEETEIMAATCIDGIGVIVRWVRYVGGWRAMVDSCGIWEDVDQSDEGNEIPADPPSSWDDLPQNPELSGDPASGRSL